MKEFYDYKGKGVNQVRLLPPAPKEWEPITQRMGRIIKRNDVAIVDYIDIIQRRRESYNGDSLMESMIKRMKIYTRLANRRRKIINLYETDKPNNVKVEEDWGFY